MDLLDILEAKKKQEAEDMLADLSIETAQYLKEESFKELISTLKKEAGFVEEPQTFDKSAFERFKSQFKR